MVMMSQDAEEQRGRAAGEIRCPAHAVRFGQVGDFCLGGLVFERRYGLVSSVVDNERAERGRQRFQAVLAVTGALHFDEVAGPGVWSMHVWLA
jgi:hypothetical protein